MSEGPAKQGRGVEIGAGVRFGQGVKLGHYVVIHDGTRVGDEVVVEDFAVLGKRPARAATSTLLMTNLPPLEVGRGTHIGTHAVVYAGTRIGADGFLADGAQVRERCRIGDGVVVGHHATIENDSVIGDRVKLQTGAYVTARSTVGDDVFIAPNVTTTNDRYLARTEARHAAQDGAHIERGARIGAGAVLLPGIHVGQEAVVAAGAVVTRDVPPYRVVMGVPAREVRDTPADQILYPNAAPQTSEG
jgi:acetyltransferase-like isoleucine patch superfamily enzyme